MANIESLFGDTMTFMRLNFSEKYSRADHLTSVKTTTRRKWGACISVPDLTFYFLAAATFLGMDSKVPRIYRTDEEFH